MASKNQPRRSAKVDGNAAQIVVWLREAGAHVIHIDGTFDLLVGLFGRWDVVEVKMPDGTCKQGQVTEMVKIASMGLPPIILATTAHEIVEEMKRRSKA